uniref:protein O-GlcNAcase n=1 Tax=Takifugu rubripes TaxID=31033 RepID=A0A674PQH8_TAKRU
MSQGNFCSLCSLTDKGPLSVFLYIRMQNWGLNTYLYGPKDDLKHRLLWREAYSPDEEGQLRTLIAEAQSRGLRFVYALSPGQDIVFSSSSDVTLLKRKLRQVSDLGCQAFAILFDDIDHSLCQADSEAFSSFAHAQVFVTNEVYRFLGEPPVFLFCPTEYCDSLCSPSVSKSPYLQTVGEDLLPSITVVWTGSKVISRKLSLDNLAEVESVLQRPPLIWDNLHANDYDSRRLFLGPFKGREPQLRGHLSGLLLNPNCEFEANYIPLHSLGSWFRTGNDENKGEGKGNDMCEYCPERALSAALRDWMEELNQPLQAGNFRFLILDSDCKMDCRSIFNTTGQEGEKKRLNQSGQCHQPPPGSRSGGGSRDQKGQGRGLCSGKGLLSESQVRLLVGLHYLPHEHGPSAQKLLQDLTWLKSNCHLVSTNNKKSPPQVEEWRGRASRFQSLCEDIAQLHCSVVGGANRAVLYDLYPYVWDLRNMALVAKAFVCWLGCGKSTGVDVLGMESEPWVFKGGVSGEVQMLLPIGNSSELFTHPPPLFPTSRLYNIRPYHGKDKVRGTSGHEDQGEYPDSLLYHFPSQLRLDALPELVDISVSRTLLATLLTALKANGSQGVFCEVQPTDRQRLEFLTKLGFLEILRGEARSREGVVLGRLL